MASRWAIVGGALAAAACFAACRKVPIIDVGAAFHLADVTWFEQEETLFFFFEAVAEQGLSRESIVEVRYGTDEEEFAWTSVEDVSAVHRHVPADCGADALCGSTSLHVPQMPRSVGLRLRYHSSGEVFLDAPAYVNVVHEGGPSSHRSMVVYGVFDESNTRVQWRGRHQFPALRNEQVEWLGLRRRFWVSDQRHGTLPHSDASVADPYLYGFADACPEDFQAAGIADPPATDERAVFNKEALDVDALASPVVCADATVEDATGTFTTAAVARKNADVRPAFPVLRSPIVQSTAVRFLLAPCERTISEEHLSMQKQRLAIEGDPDVCLERWQDEGFAEDVVALMRNRLDEVRAEGNDMVLSVAVHHDVSGGGLAAVLESVLERVLQFEEDKSSPRVSGAFVFDSYAHDVTRPAARRQVLWCPAKPPLDDDEEDPPSISQQSCAVQLDVPSLRLGPFRIGILSVLPSRSSYLQFVDRFSEAQAGRMRRLTFLAPERTPTSRNVSVGDFGAVTFFNNEVLTADATDAFSYCEEAEGDYAPVVFHLPGDETPYPLALLPQTHERTAAESYFLGLFWEFPFLLRLEYTMTLAGSVNAVVATVPFGVSNPAEEYYGATVWLRDEFPLDEKLLQCTRFCGHPAFDSAGVYNATVPWRDAHRDVCYRPRFPKPDDGGFPRDP